MKTLNKRLSRMIFPVYFLFILNGTLFSQDLNPANWPNLKGYWKFQDINNLTNATVGNDLFLIGQHQWVAGAAYGDTAIRIDTGSYYKCFHNIASNGGGDSVNRYTLMFDFKVLNFNRWHTFFQTDTTNTNDGECFIRPNTTSNPGKIGVGYTGYSSDSILPNQWYRLVISVNLGRFYNYYLNGALLHEGDTDEIYLDQRFALTPSLLFFADNNLEDDTIDISSIAIFDTCLTPAQIAQIGTIEPCIANPPMVNLGNDTTLCWNHVFQLNAGAGFKNYLWSTGDTLAAIVIDTANFGTGTDTIWVIVNDMNDCQATDSLIVTFTPCTGLDENPVNQLPLLFPNPGNGRFNLILSQNATFITVFNSSGQKVKEMKNPKAGKHAINLFELPNGIYFLRIISDGGQTRTIKAIKVNSAN